MLPVFRCIFCFRAVQRVIGVSIVRKGQINGCRVMVMVRVKVRVRVRVLHPSAPLISI